jgi:hypothetical protein
VCVVAFNTREGWSRDVSHEFAAEILRRADLEGRALSGPLASFVNFIPGPRGSFRCDWPNNTPKRLSLADADLYRRKADDARARAENAYSVADKEAWLLVAAEWLKLAEEMDERDRRRD